MAEQRKKSDSILLRTEGKMFSLELFSSDEWPEENGGEGVFRVRINDTWYCPAGKYSFLTRSAIGELVTMLLNEGVLPEDESAPYLPLRAEVLVYLDDLLCKKMGSVRSAPYQKKDGRWYAQIWVFGRGIMELCCNDVTLRRYS